MWSARHVSRERLLASFLSQVVRAYNVRSLNDCHFTVYRPYMHVLQHVCVQGKRVARTDPPSYILRNRVSDKNVADVASSKTYGRNAHMTCVSTPVAFRKEAILTTHGSTKYAHVDMQHAVARTAGCAPRCVLVWLWSPIAKIDEMLNRT
ncbi:hypothetical protein Bbelb_282280 [Branchiostoma belcheri]|nr:hypothetical protein Bbelb_282280 [Branchiostoma belcheri]